MSTILKQRIEERAAAEDRRFDRERGGLPPAARGMYIGTIHAYCLRLLENHDDHYGACDVLDDPMHWTFLWRFRKRLGLKAESWTEGEPFDKDAPLLDAFQRSAAAVYNEQLDGTELSQRCPRFMRALTAYEALLHRMRLLTFDLIIHRAVQSLAPDGALAERLRGKVRHLLVDEQQALNPAQVELIRRLVALGATLTTVGDDDQAIYQWRGGDARLFVNFKHDFPDARKLTLLENRRSVRPIVRAANLVAGTIEGRVSKQMDPARQDEADPVELVVCHDHQSEGEAIARLLNEAHDRGLPWSDMAVLLRSVRTGAKYLTPSLVRADVPYHLVGNTSLFERPELLALTRILVSWSSDEPRWRPDRFGDIEDLSEQCIRDQVALLSGATGKQLEQRIENVRALGRRAQQSQRLDLVRTLYELTALVGLVAPGRAPDPGLHASLGALVALLSSFSHSRLRAAPPPSPDQLVDADEELALAPELEAPPAEPAAPELEMAEESQETEERVQVFAPGRRLLVALRSFLETYGAEGQESPSEEPFESVNAVHVMTVHQSKGLEFPLVVVPRLTDRRFPVRPREQPWLLPRDSFDASRYEGSINDEKRLFYVALTRARDRLILSNFLFDRGGRQQRPSEFLQHLLPMQSEGTLQVSQDKARAPRFVPRVPAPSEPLLTISFSDLWDYAECGHRYLMRQRGFRPKLDPALGYGKLAHHVLAWLGRSAMSGSTASGVQVAELVLKNFYLPFAGGERRDQLRQSLTNMLSDYLDKYGADLERVIETERRFEVPLAGARIVGRMDYLLRKDNGASGVEVLEFKVKHLDVGDREHHQVRLYAEAARREGLLPLAGTLHNLAKRSRESVDLNKPPPPEFLDEVSDLIAGIRTRRFFPTTSSDACSHCDFARVCEHCPGVALK